MSRIPMELNMKKCIAIVCKVFMLLLLTLLPVFTSLPGRTLANEASEGPFATEVVSRESFTVALAPDGTVWVWGKNDHYQLGTGDTTDSPYPQQVIIPGNPVITDIDAGDKYTIALDDTGQVWVWGQVNASSYG